MVPAFADMSGIIPLDEEEEHEQELYDDVGALDEDIYEVLPGLPACLPALATLVVCALISPTVHSKCCAAQLFPCPLVLVCAEEELPTVAKPSPKAELPNKPAPQPAGTQRPKQRNAPELPLCATMLHVLRVATNCASVLSHLSDRPTRGRGSEKAPRCRVRKLNTTES